MQSKETVITNLINEIDTLKQKVFKLETFITSKDFMQITSEQKSLLMKNLKIGLIKRVYNLRWKDAQEEENKKRELAKTAITVIKHSCEDCRWGSLVDAEVCRNCSPKKVNWTPRSCKTCIHSYCNGATEPCRSCDANNSKWQPAIKAQNAEGENNGS